MAARRKVKSLATALRSELSLVGGLSTVAIFYTFGQNWASGQAPMAWNGTMFIWLFAVMVWCTFNVVRHADVLAKLLGEPYGTLILTISVVGIEVTIMASIMLSGAPNPTLPRDTMMASLMIALNLVVGLSLVTGALRHVQQHFNPEGATAFLAVISTLVGLSLILPKFTISTPNPSFTPLQATIFATLALLLYASFLVIQTVRHASFFEEPRSAPPASVEIPVGDAKRTIEVRPVTFHAILLVLSLLPVVLLADPLAELMNHGIENLKLPVALGGIVIAVLVMSPEGFTALEAAANNHLQRAVNVALGSAVATIGLTVPTVLLISVVTGHPLQLGVDHAQLVLMALTLFICQVTFSSVKTNVLLGLIHLVMFTAYVALIFEP